MAKLAELACREELVPSELKRFGKRVRYFNVECQKGEDYVDAKKRVFPEIEAFVTETGGQLYTGIHSENDWGKTRWWSKGGHLVNRTGEFAVIVPENGKN